MWVGSVDAGLMRLKGEQWKRYTPADGLPEEFVTSMHEDDGGIWLGTDGGGLVHFRAERFTLTTSKVGLYSDKIAEILEDDQGNLWMTSD